MEQTVFSGMGLTLPEVYEKSIGRLKIFEPGGGYWGAFSGGKDSIVIKQLALEAGVNVEWHYSVTTVDPFEVVWYIKQHHPDVIFDHPDKPLWAKVAERGAPTRVGRWCCSDYKECNGDGRPTILGVRWAESRARASRWGTVTPFKGRQMICPIVDWSDGNVWEFIKSRGLEYPSLYDEGYSRLGCVMCPLTTKEQREKEAIRWPTIATQWRKGLDMCWERKTRLGHDSIQKFKTKDDFWHWWMSGEYPEVDEEICQGPSLFSGGNSYD